MSATGQCPSCGNPLVFRVATTTTAVCDFCKSIVVRGGAQLELVGKVNEILASGSVLKLGLEGTYKNQPFTLVGRTQLKHDLGGIWDEWLVSLPGGKLAWLAEHQGRFALMTEVHAAEAPMIASPAMVKPGQRFITSIGELVVVERGEATIATEEGELPGRAIPGARRPFIDFSSRNGRVATLDFGTIQADGQRERRRFYVGKELTLVELGLASAEVQPVVLGQAIGAQTLRCPQCGAPVEKKLTEAESLVCSSCNSGLSVEQDGRLGFLFAQEKLLYRPLIPVGTQARLDRGFFKKAAMAGETGRPPWPSELDVEVVANVVRSVVVDGTTYTFQEHLLHTARDGFFWLVESDGEWLFVRNLEPGLVTERGPTAVLARRTFLREQHNVARVEQVVGELYYRVTKGERSTLTDFKSMPRVLSKEETDNELIWTECLMVDRRDVGRVFRITPPSPPSYSDEGGGSSFTSTGQVSPAVAMVVILLFIVFFVVLMASTSGGGGGGYGGGGHYSSGGGGGSSFGK